MSPDPNALSADAPDWFLSIYQFFVGDGLAVARPIFYQGPPQGTVVVTSNAVATAAEAWSVIGPLLGLSAALVAALSISTYFVIDGALKPTKEVLAGLNRLAQGDLAHRLPAFHLAELNRISEVFNAMSEALSKATSERTDLARRLVDAQEQERRHIARELHDDIAQKLAALNALAALIQTKAQSDAPVLAKDATKLEDMASGLMITLRRTLSYLRPQEIDDLGLLQSLRALIEQHNRSAHGHAKYSIETNGEVENLRAEASAHVYRIVQEALTNAAKHSRASNVKVLLAQQGDQTDQRIMLSITDDGVGRPADSVDAITSRSGLIGMRERVAALSGRISAGPLPGGGFSLQVDFSTAQQGA